MELFFTEQELIKSDFADFDTFESRHITRTLRKSVGDEIWFTEGMGSLFRGRIIQTNPILRVSCHLEAQLTRPRPALTLGIGLIKQNRMDILIEKATELGVDKFCFFAGKYSNYFTDNDGRWQKITRQAIKQSLRYFLPEMSFYKDLSSLLKVCSPQAHKLIAHQSADVTMSAELAAIDRNQTKEVLILIGPEGGFSPDEISNAGQAGFRSVSFGDFRLRAETAAISAAANINIIRN